MKSKKQEENNGSHYDGNQSSNLAKRQTPSNKTTITLAIDHEILLEIRNDAYASGLSLNSKVNNMLTNWARMYKYHEMEQGIILTSRNFKTLLDNIDEEVLSKDFKNNALDMIPAFFVEKNIPMTLDNLVEYAFKPFGLIGGSFQGFNIFRNEEGYQCITLRHRYGIKWSRILSAGMVPSLSICLNCHVTANIMPGVVTLKILDKNIQSQCSEQ
jgi:hypothetical protein